MLIKMRESKGFTLVELMIVVAIIGILAAVAVPFYQRYVQKSRLTSLVWPGLHSIETNVGAYYAVRNSFPDNGMLDNFTHDAYLYYITNLNISDTAQTMDFDIEGHTLLQQLDGKHLTATAQTERGKIKTWVLSGNLADELGLK
jgi:type IV pilus assembly protein PilA